MSKTFTRYQIFVIGLLAFLQFTVVLDFMILSPLGALLLDKMHITPAEFGIVVSSYAFSAGVSGLMAAGFADRFDRKRLLLFFYGGFVIGTFLCGLAPGYEYLMAARIVTGFFGGVIGSISFAIIADLFPYEMRGRVMGVIMTAFAGSQVLGLPLGLYISNLWGWHAPFIMIAGFSTPVGLVILFYLKPITEHIGEHKDRRIMLHLFKTIARGQYLYAFSVTALLASGGFMLMPFGSTFSVHNLGIAYNDLPMVYLITGLTSIVSGPLLGRLSDTYGKYIIFVFGSLLSTVVVIYYTSLGITPLWLVIVISVVLFFGISGRMVSASALTSAVPDPADRGAFMAINSSMQQLAGGFASFIAGLIVVQSASGKLEHYEELGYVVALAMVVTAFLMHRINRVIQEKEEQMANQLSMD